MAIRDDFFTALNKGAKWDVGVSINRTNPLPLDVNSVFDTKDNLDAYVAGAFAYPGQIVALVEESATTIYYIDQAKTLQEVGKLPVGDGKSVTVAEDGTISLLGVAAAETGAQLVKKADGSIEWVKPDTTTVEGLTTAVESLGNRATALEDKVGDDSKGLVKEVADLTTDVSGVKSDLADNYYNKEAVDGLVSGAFHFRGNAKELNAEGNLIGTDDKVITGNVGDVYQIGDKEYAYNGSAWVELGFTLDLSAYATTASVTTAVNDAKTELEGKIATAKSEAISDANGYTDTAITNLGIGDYAKTSEVTSAIDSAKAELTTAIGTAKSEAITTAGNNADTKIATKVGEIGDIGGEEDNCSHDEGSRHIVQQRGHAGRNDGVEADDIGGNCIGEREQYHQNEKHVPRKERCDFAHVYERLAFYPDYKQNGEQQQRKTAKPQHAEYLVQGGGLRNDAWQQQEEKRTDYADECDFLSQ